MKVNRMKEFMDWMRYRVKSVHAITNEEFVNILQKM